ncbi:hypothetical protein [uncultured Gimesia sp.]|mgnify:CR=1 FL=1|uniref:hypothetical protein n=1 Tax=uncultured Gimesia sp. TaxID=1678688 RepID=UPI0030DBFEBD|tara:strand:+ start:88862 stop:89182 length:321 start_codon:yes stop_codon:yes gene_type:complete
MSSLKERIEDLEKQVKNNKKDFFKVIKQFKYYKTIAIDCKKGEKKSVKLIRINEGFAILGEIKGDFSSEKDRAWLKRENGNWYLKARSGNGEIRVNALVFKYPRKS